MGIFLTIYLFMAYHAFNWYHYTPPIILSYCLFAVVFIILEQIQSPVMPIDRWHYVTLCRCKYIFARLFRSNRFLYMAQSDNSHSMYKATSTSTVQNPFHESISDLTIIAISLHVLISALDENCMWRSNKSRLII